MDQAQIEVELCGRLADACGPSLRLNIPDAGLSVSSLLTGLGHTYPPIGDALDRIRVRACINEAVVDNEAVVRPGDRIALFPPVSGG